MTRRTLFSFVSFVSLVVGCGGKTDGGDTTADSGSPCTTCGDAGTDLGVDTTLPPDSHIGDAGAPGRSPPPRPSTVGSGGTTKWFVVKSLSLGLTDKITGKQTADAWKSYGYDLDDRTTTADDSKSSRNSCHRVSGSPTGVLVDGNDGIDNNFGAHVMQTIKALKSDTEQAVNQSIVDGGQTLILRLDNVAGADNANVPGALFLSGRHDPSSSPRFDGTDVYPVDSSSVSSDISAPKVAFPDGYMSGGYWVSGTFDTGTIALPIALAGAPTVVPLESGVVVFRVDDGGDGTLAGAVETTTFRTALTPMIEAFGICPGNATFDQVVTTLAQSADLVSGAPLLQDTTVACNAISVGIGFTAAPMQPPSLVVTTPPPPSSCP